MSSRAGIRTPAGLPEACPLCALNGEGQNWWLGVLTLQSLVALGEFCDHLKQDGDKCM